MPPILLNFHAMNPKKMASADNQKTVAPSFAIASSPNPAPKAVTRKPLANPDNPPKMASTATQTFMFLSSLLIG